MKKQRLVARIGNSSQVPRLVPGEFGFDVDTKVQRMGDDTSTPPMIATSKSAGRIEYDPDFVTKHGTLEIWDGRTVDGVDISLLNQQPGVLVRGQNENEFYQRLISGSQYITIDDPTGSSGDFVIRASEELIAKLGGGSVKFSYGPAFPTNVGPGAFHYMTDEELLYIRLTSSEDPAAAFWIDVLSFSGSSGGIRFFTGTLPPASPALGDEWQDPDDNRIYKRVADGASAIWLDTRI